MVKRFFDVIASAVALVVLAPVFCAAAIGIRLKSPGPVFFRVPRVGLRNVRFTMYKFRTMRVDQGSFRSAITRRDDQRVFAFGSLLRRLKIDELPQLFNILKGDMSIVGPRPEDPRIVDDYYPPEYLCTLDVRPGLASPGSIYNYTHGEQILTGPDPEKEYVERLLSVKLSLDSIYVREASFLYDLRIIFRTVWTVLRSALGKRHFADPPEMKKALSY
jgi:lipopolysaccharide/colanic/teichoic acid biosynthesis glycosyltransferase